MSAKQDIIALETKFWDTMVSQDAETAAAMMAEKSIVIGPQGVSEISRGHFKEVMDESRWTLDSYKLSDVHVVFPTDETAVIGYKVKQKGTMDGKPYDMECADATTWNHSGKEWLCVLHTETVLSH
jgi:hypothetical protein